MENNVTVLYGPTASGKTAAAIKIAAQNNGVIINADAMQCYADLPMLSAQPDKQEQASAPHKLYGFIDGSENIIVTDWLKYSLEEIQNTLDAGQHPILVGGTGFYIKALIEGLSDIPDTPKELREKAEDIFEKEGLAPLLKDLDNYNRNDAAQIDRNNSRRVIRAWEVLQHTGKSIQEWQRENKKNKPENLTFDLKLITRPRDELIERIHSRFDLMIKNGVLEEVKQLSERIDRNEVAETNLIIKAHGFRALRAYLKNEISLEEAIEKSKIETRQYAKRQMTWARQQFGFQS